MKRCLYCLTLIVALSSTNAALGDQSLDNEMLAEVRKASPDVNRINHRDLKQIDGRFSVVAIYTLAVYQATRQHYRRGAVSVEETPLSGQKIGIFVIDNATNKIAITLDVMQSERGNDFFPRIQNASPVDATVSFTSDYSIEAVKRYEFDLKSSKLLSTSRLPKPPRATMCERGGKIESCYD